MESGVVWKVVRKISTGATPDRSKSLNQSKWLTSAQEMAVGEKSGKITAWKTRVVKKHTNRGDANEDQRKLTSYSH